MSHALRVIIKQDNFPHKHMMYTLKGELGTMGYYDRRSGSERRSQQITVANDQRILPDRRLGGERRSGKDRRNESRIDFQKDRRTFIFD